ncbi:hypothetical protein PR048_000099 [Dryococelus australis]|uniref:UDP-glycosyltransferase n=1 Tax=Dryococelus australis TaxID=614101 RepID=A0ABQ9IDN9_9NEOP|nr:hypothetical protein PR048_000099 [Dryococelus australis]
MYPRVLVWGAALLKTASAARILALLTLTTHSHHIWNRELTRALAARGHDLTVLSPDVDDDLSAGNLTYIHLEGCYDYIRTHMVYEEGDGMKGRGKREIPEKTPFASDPARNRARFAWIGGVRSNHYTTTAPYSLPNCFHDETTADKMRVLTRWATLLCDYQLTTAGARLLLAYPQGKVFDLIVSEAVYNHCFWPLFSKFGDPPLVAVSPSGLPPRVQHMADAPKNPAYVPDTLLSLPDSMNLLERLQSVLTDAMALWLWRAEYFPQMQAIAERHFPAPVPSLQHYEGSFSLVLSNTVLGYDLPRPLPPNVVPVGGLHLRPPAPLDKWYADNNVRRLDWPAQSPDLNPVEHLWDELDRRAMARQARPKSIAQLMEWLQEEWRRIPVDVLQTHVESMPDRKLKEFLDGSERGAIFFSLGSNLRSDMLPAEVLQDFLHVFGSLPQRVLWKFESDNLQPIPANLMLSKWLPQRDILGDSLATRLLPQTRYTAERFDCSPPTEVNPGSIPDQPMRVIEVSMGRLRDGGVGEAGDPRDNPGTSGIVRHDSHVRESGVARPGIEPGSPWREASRLTAQPPRPPGKKKLKTYLEPRMRQTQVGARDDWRIILSAGENFQAVYLATLVCWFGHKNMKLFITHNGLMSSQESLYFGVPTIGIPFFMDQERNMKRACKLGTGVGLSYKGINKDMLLSAIEQVLKNSSYAENARRMSTVFRDQIDHPLDRAVFWIEYVLRHNGAPHLRSAAVGMPLYRYLLLDVLAVLLVMLVAVLLVLRAVARWMWRRLAVLRPSSTKTKTQ